MTAVCLFTMMETKKKCFLLQKALVSRMWILASFFVLFVLEFFCSLVFWIFFSDVFFFGVDFLF